MRAEISTRAEAAKILGVPPDASADAARKAFLSQLRKRKFVANDAAFAALRHFDHPYDPSKDIDPVTEVEEFAAQYWALPVEARRAWWNQLRDVTPPKSPGGVWLAALEAGLDVPTYALGSATRKGELAEQVQWIYTSWPSDRPARRRELLRTWSSRPKEWKAATKELRHSHRKLTDLEAGFVNSTITPLSLVQSVTPVVSEDWCKVREDAIVAQQQQTEKKAAENPFHKLWWVGFIVFFGFIRACSNLHSTSRTHDTTTRQYRPSQPVDIQKPAERLDRPQPNSP